MAVSIKVIESMKEEFEKGTTPKQLAEKFKENPYRIGALARLMGYNFTTSERDIFAWRTVTGGSRSIISFGVRHTKVNMKKYKIDSIDEKKKQIIISYE